MSYFQPRGKVFAITDREHFPEQSGLYFVFRGSTLFYVGMTTARGGFRERWADHHRFEQARRSDAKICFEPMPRATRDEVFEAESEAIAKYSPEWNGTSMEAQHTFFEMLLRDLSAAAIAVLFVLVLVRLFPSLPNILRFREEPVQPPVNLDFVFRKI